MTQRALTAPHQVALRLAAYTAELHSSHVRTTVCALLLTGVPTLFSFPGFLPDAFFPVSGTSTQYRVPLDITCHASQL